MPTTPAPSLDGLAPMWHTGQALGPEVVALEQKPEGTWRLVARSERFRDLLGAAPVILDPAPGLDFLKTLKARAVKVQITR
jgi:hypothetical protein